MFIWQFFNLSESMNETMFNITSAKIDNRHNSVAIP